MKTMDSRGGGQYLTCHFGNDGTSLKPYRYCKFVADHPILSFCISLSIHVSALLVTIILILCGFDVFPLDFNGLPLVLRSDHTNTRALAFRSRTHYDNKYIRVTNDGPVSAWDRGVIADSFEVILESRNCSIFNVHNLERMKLIEDSIIEMKGFKENCLTLQSGYCEKPWSVLRFIEKAIDEKGLPETVNTAVLDRLVAEVFCEAYRNENTSSHLKVFLEKDYNPCQNDTRTKTTRIFFHFGLRKNESKMYRVTECTRSRFQNQVLKKRIEGIKEDMSREGLDIIYFSHDLFLTGAGEQAMKDAWLGVGSFLFIFIVMWIQTGSLWITFMGLYSIITSFLIANLIYRYAFGFTYIGYFHVVAMFIIIGIGADDVFVFYDTWKLTKLNQYPSLAHRLSDFYRTASRTTFVTSFTTTLVFIVTSFSPLLAVKTFGLFSAILVTVNYLFDVIYFPTAIMIYTIKIKPTYKKLYKWLKTVIRYIYNLPPEIHPMQESNSSVVNLPVKTTSKKKGVLVRFFSGTFYSFVTKKCVRVSMPLFFLTCSGFFIYWSTRLQTSTGMIEIFKSSHMYGRAYWIHQIRFQHLLDTDYTDVYLLWGMKDQDISSCDLKSSTYCSGSVRWDRSFDPSSEKAQLSLENLCDRLRHLPDGDAEKLMIRRRSEGSDLDIDCFTTPMAAYFNKSTHESIELPYNKRKIETLMKDNESLVQNISATFNGWFGLGVEYWMSNGYTGNSSTDIVTYNDLLGARIIPGQTVIVNDGPVQFALGTEMQYITVRIGTKMNFQTMSYTQGNLVHDAYEQLLSETMIREGRSYWQLLSLKLGEMPDTMKGGFQLTEVTWHWMRVQEILVTYGLQGLGISLGVALPVLIISSMNVYIGLIATLTIGLVITCAIGLLPLTGHDLGVIESVNLYMVVGLSVDYVVHFAEAYQSSTERDRKGRVKSMLENMALSVTSGALTTFGAASFMLGAQIRVIFQFGMFVMTIISLSYIYSVLGFTTFMALCGPEGENGSLTVLWQKLFSCIKKNKSAKGDAENRGHEDTKC